MFRDALKAKRPGPRPKWQPPGIPALSKDPYAWPTRGMPDFAPSGAPPLFTQRPPRSPVVRPPGWVRQPVWWMLAEPEMEPRKVLPKVPPVNLNRPGWQSLIEANRAQAPLAAAEAEAALAESWMELARGPAMAYTDRTGRYTGRPPGLPLPEGHSGSAYVEATRRAERLARQAMADELAASRAATRAALSRPRPLLPPAASPMERAARWWMTDPRVEAALRGIGRAARSPAARVAGRVAPPALAGLTAYDTLRAIQASAALYQLPPHTPNPRNPWESHRLGFTSRIPGASPEWWAKKAVAPRPPVAGAIRSPRGTGKWLRPDWRPIDRHEREKLTFLKETVAGRFPKGPLFLARWRGADTGGETPPGHTRVVWDQDTEDAFHRWRMLTGRAPTPNQLIQRAQARQRAAVKQNEEMAVKMSGHPATYRERQRLDRTRFVAPETRSFPIRNPGDVARAVRAFGRSRLAQEPGGYARFRRRLSAMAHRLGGAYTAQLPNSWRMAGKARALGRGSDPAWVPSPREAVPYIAVPVGTVPGREFWDPTLSAPRLPKGGPRTGDPRIVALEKFYHDGVPYHRAAFLHALQKDYNSRTGEPAFNAALFDQPFRIPPDLRVPGAVQPGPGSARPGRQQGLGSWLQGRKLRFATLRDSPIHAAAEGGPGMVWDDVTEALFREWREKMWKEQRDVRTPIGRTKRAAQVIEKREAIRRGEEVENPVPRFLMPLQSFSRWINRDPGRGAKAQEPEDGEEQSVDPRPVYPAPGPIPPGFRQNQTPIPATQFYGNGWPNNPALMYRKYYAPGYGSPVIDPYFWQLQPGTRRAPGRPWGTTANPSTDAQDPYEREIDAWLRRHANDTVWDPANGQYGGGDAVHPRYNHQNPYSPIWRQQVRQYRGNPNPIPADGPAWPWWLRTRPPKGGYRGTTPSSVPITYRPDGRLINQQQTPAGVDPWAWMRTRTYNPGPGGMDQPMSLRRF